jgi:hypothetical protein
MNSINSINQINNIRRYINLSLIIILFASIFALFYVKFKFEDYEEKLTLVNEEISEHENKLNLLGVELVYLSRPKRLIEISQKYLKNTDHVDIVQIKDYKILRKYYLTNLDNYHKNKIALNE